MKNYLILGAGFLTLLVVCVAVIRYEAEETRKVMRESAAVAVKEGLTSTIKGAADPKHVDDAVDKINSILGETTEEATKEAPGLVKPAAQAAREVFQELHGVVTTPRAAATPQPAPASTRARPSSDGPRNILEEIEATMDEILGRDEPSSRDRDDMARRDDKDEEKSDGKRRPLRGYIDPQDPVGSIIEITRRASKSGDDYAQNFMKLTTAEEQAWGKKLHAEVLVESKVIRDPEVNRRLTRVAAPLLERRTRMEISYTFTVIHSEPDDLNAFSLPGGYIYVHSALLDFIRTDDELQFVLAHEIAHVDLEHCSRKLTFAARASDLTAPAIGGFVGILHNFMARPYAKDEEFVADEYALKGCVAAGQTRERALEFPRRFAAHVRAKPKPARSPRESNILAEIFRRGEDHFSTHPPVDERIARLEAVVVE